ncbi:MAG: T9SS type A sorting domain-containing protein [Chitinophagales bacterium]|nr:T9SS type A sorting domain-containing protein [Chitinophagaceae bacterium]MCB9065844.1 T9SS type A sorting domain-containing protein [Chitinophagales bacterium]
MKHVYCLLAALLLLTARSEASHLMGGELRYEFNGTNYTVTLKLYRDCSGIALPNSVAVTLSSASQSSSFNLTLSLVKSGLVTTPCPGSANKCTNTSSVIPGYGYAEYVTSVAVPAAASDWKFEASLSARTTMQNVAGGGNMYLVATLDNSAGVNSTPYMPNYPPFYQAMGSTSVVPMQVLDPDGDSIVVEPTAPLISASTSVTYVAGGYSPTAPYGSTGTFNVNNSNQTLTIKCTNNGQFAGALKIKEYRNGKLLGYYIREFGTAYLPGGTSFAFTYPQITTTSNQVAYTCPGKPGSASLSFTDPNSVDSVYITVDTPAYGGWNFTVSTLAGKPTATTSISWTAPANLNPSIIPYFYVKLHVVDNACPRAPAEYALLVIAQQCPTDSVWPGDANSDKVVNLLDPLYIAVAYNQTGPKRPSPSTSWVPQWAQNWSGSYPISGVNHKHGDCNGDGTINASDLGAVAANWGLTHPKGGPRSKTTGVPELFYDVTGVTFSPGAVAAVPIKLGSVADPMSDFYGIGTSVLVNGITLDAQAYVASAGTWIGTTGNTMEFSKDISKSRVEWALARTDHQNTTGNGTIGTLYFKVPASATIGTNFTLDFANTVIVDKDGKLITQFNTKDATAQVTVGIDEVASNLKQVFVVPNPSDKFANLHVELSEREELHVNVTDISGKVLWHFDAEFAPGANSIALPGEQLANGMYMINISGKDKYKTLKWIKQ